MQVAVENTSNLGRKLTVGIPSDKVDSAVEIKVKDAAKGVRIDGFRPGKVPLREVRRRFGPAIRQEVVGELIQQSFYEAITKESLQPAGMPSIEPGTNEAGKDVEFTATFEVFPSITLGNLEGIEVERLSAEITDADVNEMIDSLRKQRETFVDKDGAAENGDQLNIDFVGTKDGESFEGGSAEGSDLTLGSGSMIPGFEDGLLGAKAGEERVLNLTFPEDYQSEDLQGQATQFAVTVNSVKSPTLPEIDEEFIKSFGVADGTKEALLENIRKNMGAQLENSVKGKVKNQVMEALLVRNEFDVPQATVDQEIDRQKRQMVQQFGEAAAQMDLSFLPNDMFQEKSEKAVKLGLLFNEVMQSLDLTEADPDKVRAFIENAAANYDDPNEVINHYYGNQEQLQQIESVVLEEQVVDKLLESAVITDKVCSYQEAIKNDDAPEDEE